MRDKTDAWKSTDPSPLWLMIPQQAFDLLEGLRLEMFAIECKEASDDMDGALKQNKVLARCVGGFKITKQMQLCIQGYRKAIIAVDPAFVDHDPGLKGYSYRVYITK